MKKIQLLLPICLAMLMLSCKNEKKEDTIDNETQEEVVTQKKELTIVLEPRSNSNARGKITFVEENGMVHMTAKFEGLTAETHAIHLHEKADCSAADGTSTGGHWNPTFERHGKWGDAEGYHKGDIGNFNANASGNGELDFKTDEWCIGCGDDTKDILGKSVIVHAGVDDFVTQPTGDAGGRISCGGIIQ